MKEAPDELRKEVASLTRKLRRRDEIIARLKGRLQTAERLATHDTNTGAPNRRSFENALRRFCAQDERSHRDGKEVPETAVIYFDLDRFKAVNDMYGHHAGDELLLQFYDVLKRHFRRPDDLVARLGGDEWGIICRNLSRPALSNILKRIEADIDRELKYNELSVRASFGLTVVKVGETAEMIIRRADAAMYRRKRSRR